MVTIPLGNVWVVRWIHGNSHLKCSVLLYTWWWRDSAEEIGNINKSFQRTKCCKVDKVFPYWYFKVCVGTHTRQLLLCLLRVVVMVIAGILKDVATLSVVPQHTHTLTKAQQTYFLHWLFICYHSDDVMGHMLGCHRASAVFVFACCPTVSAPISGPSADWACWCAAASVGEQPIRVKRWVSVAGQKGCMSLNLLPAQFVICLLTTFIISCFQAVCGLCWYVHGVQAHSPASQAARLVLSLWIILQQWQIVVETDTDHRS